MSGRWGGGGDPERRRGPGPLLAGTVGVGWHGARVAAAALALTRLAEGATRRRPVQPARPAEPLAERVSVVIPARDEAARLPACLGPLVADRQVTEVIVVDDCSTDATAEIAAALGARVVSGAPPPPGWIGKPWALQQGLEAATGDWVLCLDADVRPRPGLVAAMLEAMRSDGLDLLSLGGSFACEGTVEQALHASMLATLVYRFGPPGARRVRPPAFRMANGQCLLAGRTALAEAGGFALAAPHMTDDIALVRALAARGWRTDMLDGAACLEVRMHTGALSAWRDWGRSLPMPDVTPPALQAIDLVVLWLAVALPPWRLAMRRGDLLDAALVIARIGLGWALLGSYRRPRRGAALAPLLDLPVAARVSWGALRPGRSWRGRTYPRRAGLPAPPPRTEGR